jgi:hypothetical protein
MDRTNAERQRRYIARLKADTARIRKLEAEVAKLKANNASLRARIADLQPRPNVRHRQMQPNARHGQNPIPITSSPDCVSKTANSENACERPQIQDRGGCEICVLIGKVQSVPSAACWRGPSAGWVGAWGWPWLRSLARQDRVVAGKQQRLCKASVRRKPSPA